MKRLILAVILLIALPMVSNAQVNAYSIFGAGHQMTDGGSSHMKLFVGGEIYIKQDTAKGFTLKTRTLYTQVRNSETEIQGLEIWEITEQTLSKKTWGWFVAAGIGMFNEVEEGDDLQRLTLKFETGVDLFNKVPIAFGVDLIPTDGAGDKEFIYGMLNFKL